MVPMPDDALILTIERVVRKLPPDQVAALARALQSQMAPTAEGRRVVLSAVATPRFAAVAGGFLDAWESMAKPPPGSAMALALQATSYAVREERQRESVEIVWTGPTTVEVPVRLTREALIDVIRAARSRLTVVSFAAYKVDVVVRELKEAGQRGVDVRLILETDQAGGGTLTLDAAHAFFALGAAATFFVWPADQRPALDHGKASLHAKAAIADDHTALVTSANLTGHALSGNMELGLLVRGGPVPRRLAAHFERLMSTGVLVTTPA